MNLISAPANISSKDLPLREDMRLLGRILGDTLREQEGEASFQLVENVRRAAVRFRKTRMIAIASNSRQMLDALSPGETLSWCVPSAISRNCPTLPKTCTTTAAIARISRRAAHRRTAACCWRWSVPKKSNQQGNAAGFSRQRPDFAGTDRAPDRSAAQEHPRLPADHFQPAVRA